MKSIFTLLLFTAIFPLKAQEQKRVNIYSFREERLIAPLIEKFSSATGIKVNVVSGKADRLMDRLIKDGDSSFADLVLTTNVARLEKAKELGLLQVANSATLQQYVPSELKDPKGYWHGISIRARAIFYAKDKVDPSKIKSYEDLTKPEWQGKVCSRKGSHIYNRAMVSSFIYRFGIEWTQNWANGITKNLAMRPNGGDRDQLRNIHKGHCDIALANSYYFGMMSASSKQQDREVYNSVGVIWPDQQKFGTHINISGAAITKAAKNKENALAFIDFLVQEQAQTIYSEINHEFPIKQGIKSSELLKSWGPFEMDKGAIRHLYPYFPQADDIIVNSNW